MDKIDLLKHSGVIKPIDYHFSKLISDLSGSTEFSLMLAAALVSQATGNKHVCLNLQDLACQLLVSQTEDHEAIRCPELNQWIEDLKSYSVIGCPGQIKPLILDEQKRLYLYRYWTYEKDLADAIKERSDGVVPIDLKKLMESLNRLFPDNLHDNPIEDENLQKIAALVCGLKRICIITGGPGTGKTFTIARILAALLEQSETRDLNILMATPTGKAAVRLRESIITAKKYINSPAMDAIPEDPQTLHRLLKPIFGTPYFKHGQSIPLLADVVVVDEASMVDIALMAKLMWAVPEHARVILIGDKDQLASVEAGSVLGDICGSDENGKNHSRFWQDYLLHANTDAGLENALPQQSKNPLDDCIVRLKKSYRFADSHGMDTLALAIKTGEFKTVKSVFASFENPDLKWIEFQSQNQLREALEKNIIEGYAPYLMAKTVSEALNQFERYKILCAVNKGVAGVEGINRIAESVLGAHHLIDPKTEWYTGQPVLINTNAYDLGLFNGDIGILWPESHRPNALLYAYFPDSAGNLKKVLPQRLPNHETAFALTIHKTQGSEFDSVLMILPNYDTPILTRELLYTGVTRARSKLTLWADSNILKTALSRKIQRHSGLRDLLQNA